MVVAPDLRKTDGTANRNDLILPACLRFPASLTFASRCSNLQPDHWANHRSNPAKDAKNKAEYRHSDAERDTNPASSTA